MPEALIAILELARRPMSYACLVIAFAFAFVSPLPAQAPKMTDQQRAAFQVQSLRDVQSATIFRCQFEKSATSSGFEGRWRDSLVANNPETSKFLLTLNRATGSATISYLALPLTTDYEIEPSDLGVRIRSTSKPIANIYGVPLGSTGEINVLGWRFVGENADRYALTETLTSYIGTDFVGVLHRRGYCTIDR